MNTQGIITLIVKGDLKEAEKQLTKRGIPFNPLDCYYSKSHLSTTVRNVDRGNLIAIQNWFIEGPAQPPFPEGSLLHWSQEKTYITEEPKTT